MNDEIKEKIKAYYIGNDIDKVLDYITNLQKENEKYKRINEEEYKAIQDCKAYINECVKLQTIIDKAIEYINENSAFMNDDEWEVFNKKELLNILNGGDENE